MKRNYMIRDFINFLYYRQLTTIFNSLRRLDGNVIFTCRIIHSVKMMTSVVQIFFQDKMAAVAHVIGTEQLPMKSQVKLDRLCILTCILLNYNLICSNAFIANDVKTTNFPNLYK